MSHIFRKTAKGLIEVDTRQHRLSPRVRSMLILVDGKRDEDQLLVVVPQQGREALTLLQEHGLIEVVGESAPAPPVRAAGVDVRIDLALPTMAHATADRQFHERRRLAVRELNEQLGPSAEGLAMRMERATSAADMRALVSTATQLIANARGATAAQAYSERHTF